MSETLFRKLQHFRTTHNLIPSSPPALLEGELFFELSGHTKMWVGAPASGGRLLFTTDPADAPALANLFLRTTGGTLLGPLQSVIDDEHEVPWSTSHQRAFTISNSNNRSSVLSFLANTGGTGTSSRPSLWRDIGVSAQDRLNIGFMPGLADIATDPVTTMSIAPNNVRVNGSVDHYSVGTQAIYHQFWPNTTSRAVYLQSQDPAGGYRFLFGFPWIDGDIHFIRGPGLTSILKLGYDGTSVFGGPLMVSRDPLADLEVANKRYVDSRQGAAGDQITIIGGGTANDPLSTVRATNTDIQNGVDTYRAITAAGLRSEMGAAANSLPGELIKSVVPAIAQIYSFLEALVGTALILGGAYDVVNNRVIPTANPANPFVDGPLPVPTAAMSRWYLVVVTDQPDPPFPDNAPPTLGGYSRSDWLGVDNTPSWVHLQLGLGGADILASNVSTTAIAGIFGANVQAVLSEIQAAKLSRNGDTMLAPLTMASTINMNNGQRLNFADAAGHQMFMLLQGDNHFIWSGTNFVGAPRTIMSMYQSLDSSPLEIHPPTVFHRIVTFTDEPTIAAHAATKGYVDTVGSQQVSRNGDTMTGFLQLVNALPTTDWQAAPKQYVDNAVGSGGAHADQISIIGEGTTDSPLTVGRIDCGVYTPPVISAITEQG